MESPTRRLPSSVFAYEGGELVLEGVRLSEIAKAVGTPFYCYSAGRLRERYRELATALGPLGVDIHFATKANSNRAVLALLAAEGAGADIVSGGELARALSSGIPASRVVFSGVGKTEAEIEAALAARIHQINVESFEELALVDRVAGRLGLVAEVALRINPDVDAETHAKITTGKKDNKFGIDAAMLGRLDNEVKGLAHVKVVGLAIHIGSQILSTKPFIAAYRRIAELTRTLRGRGFALTRLDLGGGFGVPYENELGVSFADVAEAIRSTVGDLGCALSVEPGRSIVADAGVLVASVAFVKDAGAKQFAVLDAAMNDLVRPAMYDSHHDIVPVREPAAGAAPVEYDVVGPICESSDTFAKRRMLSPLQGGDLVVLATAGAYGATMSSTYNARALIPEVLVDAGRFAVVRRRITIEEQMGWEAVPEWAAAPAAEIKAAE